MIITKPFIWQIMERLGYAFHHTATHGGYRRSHFKGNRKSKYIYGYLRPYSGRFGVGFVLERSSESVYQNHKIDYFIKLGSVKPC